MLIVFVAIILCVATIIGIFFLTFKTAYLKNAQKYATLYSVDTSLVMAIIKAESKFDKNAYSSAGAIGLMQVKLDTANYMLQKLGESNITTEELYDADTNIKVGAKYIQYLLAKFQNIEVSICAYNAGETTVSNWLKSPKFSSDGKTLFKIPYAETRTYLSKVMFNYKIYKNFYHL